MPPAAGSQCSRNSRWFTVPRQQPCSHSREASASAGGGGAVGALGPVLGAVGALGAALGAPVVGAEVAGVDAPGACARTAGAASASTPARSAVRACRIEIIIVASLRPRERQVEQQVLRLES